MLVGRCQSGCGRVEDRPVTSKKGDQAGPPSGGEGKVMHRATQSLRANSITSQRQHYSHSRSSGLDLSKKFSSTLALRDTRFGCSEVALAPAG